MRKNPHVSLRRIAQLCIALAALALGAIPFVGPRVAHATPPPPTITSSSGSATSGTACANCVVDVYQNGGSVVVGEAIADGAGNWSIPAPMPGPLIVATATDFSGTSAPSATFATACTGPICIAGQYEIDYENGAPFNHCTAYADMIGDGSAPNSVNGTLDCTTAHGGTFTGSFNQITKLLTSTVSFSSLPTPPQFASDGFFSPNGAVGIGTPPPTGWCYLPGCAVKYGWTATRVSPTAAARIGSGGGTITTALGDSIVFPFQSVGSPTNITVQSAPLPAMETPPAGALVISRAYRALPDGLTFNPAALPTVTIKLTPADVNGLLDVNNVRVMVWDSVAASWVFIGGTITPSGPDWLLTFQPPHFTDYGFFDCKTGLADYDGDALGNVCDPDDDNDVCADTKETALVPALNPLNEWDFYTVPVPALLLNQPSTRDSGIGVTTDVVALLKYAGKVSTDIAYTQDKDLNGVQDGLQYDRKPKIVGPNIFPDPPDGGIGVTTDVVTMLKWAGKTC